MSGCIVISDRTHGFVIRDSNKGLALKTLRENIGDEAFKVFVGRHLPQHGYDGASAAEIGDLVASMPVAGVEAEPILSGIFHNDVAEGAVNELNAVEPDSAFLEKLPGDHPHNSSSRADFDNRTMTEAAGESISSGGGASA